MKRRWLWLLVGLLSSAVAEGAKLTVRPVRVAPQRAIRGEEIPLLRLDMTVNEQKVHLDWIRIEKIGDLDTNLFAPQVAPDGTLLNPATGYVRLWFDYDGDFQFNPNVDVPLNCRINLFPDSVVETGPKMPQPQPYRPDPPAYTVYGNFVGTEASGRTVVAARDQCTFDGFNTNYTNEYDPYGEGDPNPALGGGDGDPQDWGQDHIALPIFSSDLIYDWDGTSTYPTIRSLVGGRTLVLDAGVVRSFFITVKIPDNASVGRRIGVRLSRPGNIALQRRLFIPFDDEVDPANFPMESDQVVVVGNTLQVQAEAVNPTHAALGQSDVPMMRLTLQVDRGQTVVDSITLHDEGTNPDGDVREVRLHRDNPISNDGKYVAPNDDDADGLIDEDPVNNADDDMDGRRDEDPPGPGTIGDPVVVRGTFGGGRVTFSRLNLTVQAGQPVVLFVVYDMAPGATVGNRLQTRIGQGDILLQSPDDVVQPAAFLARSRPLQVAGRVVRVSGRGLLPSRSVQGVGNLPALHLAVEVPSNAANGVVLQGITLHKLGTSTDGGGIPDILRLRIWQDNDVSGTVTPGDREVSDPNLTFQFPLGGAGQTVTVALNPPIPFNPGQRRLFLVALDLNPQANTNVSVGVSLERADNVVGSPGDLQFQDPTVALHPDPVATQPFRIASGELTIADTLFAEPTDQTASFPALSVARGARGVPILTFSLRTGITPAGNASVEVKGIQITRFGGGADEDIEQVLLVEGWNDANGNGFFEEGEGQVAAQGLFKNRVVNFDFRRVIRQGEKPVYWVVFHFSGVATAGLSHGARLDIGGIQVADPDEVSTRNLPIASRLTTIGDTLEVRPFSVAPANGVPGQEGIPVFAATLQALSGEVQLQGVRVRLLNPSGGPGRAGDVSSATLYLDANRNGRPDPQDAPLARGQFSQSDSQGVPYADFSFDLRLRTREEATHLLLAINLANDAVRGDDLVFEVKGVDPNNPQVLSERNSIQVAFPDQVRMEPAPFRSQPLRVGSSLLVEGAPVGDPRLFRGQRDVPLIRVTLRASPLRVIVQNLTVERFGTAPDPAVTRIRLFRDDGNGLFDPSRDAQLGSEATFAGGQAIFRNLNLQVTPGQPVSLFVVVDIARDAPNGTTLGVQWSRAELWEVDGESAVDRAPFPVRSSEYTIEDGLQVETLSLVVPPQISQGAPKVPLLRLRLTALTGSIGLSSLRLDKVGGADADVAAVSLYLDTDKDGQFSPLRDTLIDRPRQFGENGFPGRVVFTGLQRTINEGEPLELFVVVDVASNATVGNPLQVRIADASYVGVQGNDVVQSFSPIVSPQATIVASQLNIANAPSLAPSPVEQGQRGVVMDRWQLSSTAGEVLIQSIQVSLGGTALPTDVSRIRIVRDVNGNGVVDVGVDLDIASPQAFDAQGRATFPSLSLKVRAGEPLVLLPVVDISEIAALGSEIRVGLASGAAVGVAGQTQVVLERTPLESGPSRVAGNRLQVALQSLLPAQVPVVQASRMGLVPVLKVSLTSAVGEVLLTRLRVRDVGSASAQQAVLRVRLFEDVNNNGLIEPSVDRELTQGQVVRFVPQAGEEVAEIAGLTLAINPLQPRTLLLTYEIQPTATVGTTLQAELRDGDIEVASPDQVVSFGPWRSEVGTLGHVLQVGMEDPPTRPDVVERSQTFHLATLALTHGSALGDTDRSIVLTGLRLALIGTAQDADVQRIDLYRDANDNGRFDAADLLLSTGAFTAGRATLTLTSNNEVAPGGTVRLFFVLTLAETAQAGRTLGVRLDNPAFVVVAPPSFVAEGTFPLQSALVSLLGNLLVVRADPTLRPPSQVPQGVRDVAMLRLELSTPVGRVPVQGLRVERLGVGSRDLDLSAVKLYRPRRDEQGNPFPVPLDSLGRIQVDPARIELVASGIFTAGSLTFSGLSVLVEAGRPETLYIAFDLSPTATLGVEVGVGLRDPGSVQVAAPHRVAASDPSTGASLFPIASPLPLVRGNLLRVSRAEGVVPAASVPQGAMGVRMLALRLEADSGSVLVDTLRLQETGTAVAARDVAAVRLFEWIDLNGDGRIDANEPLTVVGATTFPAGSEEASFQRLNLEVSEGRPRLLVVAFDIAPDATPNATLQVQLSRGGLIVVSPDGVEDFAPLSSPQVAIIPAPGVLNVGGFSVAPAAVVQGQQDVPFLVLEVRATSSDVEVTGLRLEALGTAIPDVAVSEVKLYEWQDTNGNNVVDAGELSPTPLGRGNFPPGARQVDLAFRTTVAAGAVRRWVVALDISPRASEGATVGMQLASLSVTPPSSVQLAGVLASRTATIRRTAFRLTVSGVPLAPTYAAPGQSGVPLLRLNLEANAGVILVEGLTLEKVGAPGTSAVSDADVALVWIVRDANRNGVFDPGLDAPLGAVVGFQAGVARFGTAAGQPSLDLRVQAGTPETLFVLVDLAPTAQLGSTLGVRLSSPASVQVAPPDVVDSANFPLFSGTFTVRNVVNISAQSLAPNQAQQGEAQVPMLRLLLTTPAGRVELKGLRVHLLGTATDADLSGATLVLDNGDGLLELQQDTVLVSAPFVGGQANLTLAGTLVIAPETPRSLFILLGVKEEAVAGRLVALQLPSPGAVQLQDPQAAFVPAAFFPIASESTVLTGNPVSVALASQVPAAVTPGQRDVLFASLTFSVSTGSARLNTLRLQRLGSGVDSDLQNVRLVRDDNGDGVWQPAERTLLGLPQGVAGGTVVFSGLDALITRAQPLHLFLVADVSDRAALGRTHAFRIATAEAVQVALPDTVVGTFPLSTAFTILGGGLVVTGNNLAPPQVAAGARNVAFLRLAFTASGGAVTVDSLRLTRRGTLEERFVQQVRLHRDANGNGRFDPGVDPVLGEPQIFVQGRALFSGLNLAVPTTGEVGVLVVLDLVEQAPTGQTVGVGLMAAGDVIPVGTVSVADVGFPILSQEALLTTSQVTVSGVDLAPPTAQPGAKEVPLLRLTFQTAGGATRLRGLLLERLGQGQDADVTALRLFQDTNGNGLFEPGVDGQIGTDVPFQEGRARFAGLDVLLQEGQPVTLFVAVEISLGATLGNRVGVALTAPDAVELSGAAQVAPVNFPLRSGTVGIYALTRLRLPAGKSMVSVPTEPADPTPLGVFGQNAPLARWDPRQGIYVRPPDPYAAELHLGNGYWTQLMTAVDRDVPGIPASATQDFAIALQPGWNMIGHPFPFAVSWAQVRVRVAGQTVGLEQARDWVRDFAWKFVGGGPYGLIHPSVSNAERLLEPGLGYWVYAQVAAELLIPPRVASAGRQEVRERRADEWSIPLVVRVGHAEDAFNLLGMSRRPVQVLNPPPVEEGGADLYFRSEGGEPLAVDLRPPRAGRVVWETEVVAPQGETVEVLWPDLSLLPAEYDLFLITPEGTRRSLRTQRHYTFVAGEAPQRLQWVLEPRRPSALRLTGVQVMPTRGEGWELTFHLGAEARMEVSLQSASGQLLRRWDLGQRSAGRQRWVGEMRDAEGRPLPNGVYLLTLLATDEEGHSVRVVRTLPWQR